MQAKIKDLTFGRNGEQILTIVTKQDLRNLVDELKDIDLDVTIKKHREKRSLDANAYAWKIITEIANVLRRSKEEIYFQMLKEYGQSEIVSVLSEINVKGYFKHYEAAGEGEVNGKEFTHYKVYKGSSEYDTREMSILIDGIVDEAKGLGIETLTPQELEKMTGRWGNG